MRDLDRAVERLPRALAARERIVVYGDYDVDGIAGSAILVRAFRQLGAVVGAYIPNRYEEGYGLNGEALRKLAADGTRVVVSVDCGVTAVREALLARELGIDLIITDHHHPPAVLPDPYALVNPRRAGDPSPEKDLAGAGVALVLARHLLGELGYALRESELLQLCALATVADVVPLRGANRALTRARLVEDYGRPAVVIAVDGTEGKGSCRSIAGVHIAEALDECDDILSKHGGHAMAAGFSVPVERIGELTERLDEVVRRRLAGVRPVPSLRVDAEIAAEALTSPLALELATLEPSGAGDPRPSTAAAARQRRHRRAQEGAAAPLPGRRHRAREARPRLRRRGARHAASGLGRAVHHAPRRGSDARRRARDGLRDRRGRAPPRRPRGHRAHDRGRATRLRRGDRPSRRWRHQAVASLRAVAGRAPGREHPQDAPRDGRRPAGRHREALRPPP